MKPENLKRCYELFNKLGEIEERIARTEAMAMKAAEVEELDSELDFCVGKRIETRDTASIVQEMIRKHRPIWFSQMMEQEEEETAEKEKPVLEINCKGISAHGTMAILGVILGELQSVKMKIINELKSLDVNL